MTLRACLNSICGRDAVWWGTENGPSAQRRTLAAEWRNCNIWSLLLRSLH